MLYQLACNGTKNRSTSLIIMSHIQKRFRQMSCDKALNLAQNKYDISFKALISNIVIEHNSISKYNTPSHQHNI